MEALSILKKEKKAIEFFINTHPIFDELEYISSDGKDELGTISLTDSILTIIAKINVDNLSQLEIYPLLKLLSFIKKRLSEVHISQISKIFLVKGAGVFFQLVERIVFRKV